MGICLCNYLNCFDRTATDEVVAQVTKGSVDWQIANKDGAASVAIAV